MAQLRIAAVSDTHGFMPNFPSHCDIAIFAGDVCTMGDHHIKAQHRWLSEQWMTYLRTVPAKLVIWTWGNHDYIGDAAHLALKNGVEIEPYLHHLDMTKTDPHIRLLVNEMTEWEGLKIFGYPYVSNLPQWAFNRSDEVLEEMAAKIPPCDILVTHAPPKGYGDMVGGFHVGDPYLAANLERIRPKLVICGHIHEAFGHYRHQYVKYGIWSVSFVDHNYRGRVPTGLVHILI